MNVTALKSGDFVGLSGVTYLDLEDNQITTLPADVFKGLASLQTLKLTFTSWPRLRRNGSTA